MKALSHFFVFILFIGASSAQAAISVDSSLARTTGTPADNVNITSSSFTPPANSLLLVFVNADNHQDYDINIALSDSQGLTWTKIQEADLSGGSGLNGHTSAWYAKVVTSTAMTISAKRTLGAGETQRISFKTYIITGHDTAQPIGASNRGSSTTNNFSSTVLTSTVNNSRTFGAMTDWHALGSPTSTDTYESDDYPGFISLMSVYKAADTATGGTAVTLNFDAAGTSAPESTWVAVEVRPSGADSQACTSPAGANGQIQWDGSTIKYCSAGAWYDTTHTVGASCAGTTAGTMTYSASTLNYCNGTNWVSMKGSYLSSCSGTTAGTFNFSGNKFRFCDGTNWYQTGPSEITFKQVQENITNLNTNSIATGVYTSPVGEKNLLICWVFYNSATASVSSMSDTNGNTYTKAIGPQTGAGTISSWRQEIWYAANVTGGASLNTTATFSTTFSASKNISCHEYSGAATTNPIDQTSQGVGSSTNASTGNITTTTAKQLIFSAAIFSVTGIYPGSSFTQRSSLNSNCSEDRSAPTTGTYNGTYVHITSGDWIAQIISIKPQ